MNFEYMLTDYCLNKMTNKIAKINHKYSMDKLYKIINKL